MMGKAIQDIAPGIACLPVYIVNVYFVGEPGQPWVVVDTGTPGSTRKILAAAEARYGKDARPQAILLTHGHTDHVGCAAALADFWNVPIYAHPLELPYLTSKSKYPPKDPTVGGAMALMSRVFPMNMTNLDTWVESLPEGGAVPFLTEWEWFWTPGHTPGHVAYFRKSDRALLAGDAFATVNSASFRALLTQKPEISLPAASFTCDWQAADESVQLLAGLHPSVIACGHGVPISAPTLPDDLNRFADNFTPPAHGRYAGSPARTNKNGIVSVPPPVPDPFPRQTTVIAGAAMLLAGAIALARRRQ